MGVKATFVILFQFIVFGLFSQMYNSGAITVTDGVAVTVSGGTLRNDVAGNIDNNGNIYVDIDIDNGGIIQGGSLATSEFNLGQDWVNDGTFNADSSTVTFFGNDQFITGSSVTRFYHVIFDGNGVKAQTINAETNTMDLTSNELATNDYVMTVLSPDVNAISRTNGFVSSLNDGYLERMTNSTNPYLFPTGSSTQILGFYRPVIMTPNSNALGSYGVRLAHTDATFEGYDRSMKAENVKSTNPFFYHHLYRLGGAPTTDITFQYLPQDGTFENAAQWWFTGQWESNFIENTSGGAFNEVSIFEIGNFNTRAFILANRIEPIFVQNSFTPNGDLVNDVFELQLSEEDFEEFQFLIFNRWGEVIFETTNPNFSWDGSYKGKDSPVGVYPYRMSYRYEDQATVNKEAGHINLIR